MACEIKDNGGCVPLHYACMILTTQNPENLKMLIAASPEACSIQDADGYVPLHFACWEGTELECLKVLVAANPEACAIQDKTGKLPIDFLRDGKPELVDGYMRAQEEALAAAANQAAAKKKADEQAVAGKTTEQVACKTKADELAPGVSLAPLPQIKMLQSPSPFFRLAIMMES